MCEEERERVLEGKDKASKGADMSFWEHLEVLRWVILRVLIVYVVISAVLLWIVPYIFSSFVLGPTSDNFFVYRYISEWSHGLVAFNEGFHIQIININLASQLMTHINTALLLALVVTFPYIVYELWLYIRPALFPNELRHIRAAFIGGTVMFFLGCFVGYTIVFPFTFRFLAEYKLSSDIVNEINLQSYISTFSSLILVIGILFEMPLVAWLLSNLGLLDKQFLRHYRRHAIVVLLILAAFITPPGGVLILIPVFAPLYLLYELSILVVKEGDTNPQEKGT